MKKPVRLTPPPPVPPPLPMFGNPSTRIFGILSPDKAKGWIEAADYSRPNRFWLRCRSAATRHNCFCHFTYPVRSMSEIELFAVLKRESFQVFEFDTDAELFAWLGED